MATLADVRTGIANTLVDALPGVNVYRVPVDNIDPPALIVAGLTLTPSTLDSGAVVTADVYAAVSRRDVEFIDDLDALVDPNGTDSAWVAIIDDHTLGGLVMSAAPLGVGEYRELIMGDVGYYAATMMVEVLL